MPAESVPERSKPRLPRAIKVLFVLALLSALLLTVVGILFVRWWGRPAREVDDELARLQRVGEPIFPDELEAFYRVPPGELDTTEHWLTATFALHQALEDESVAKLPLVGRQARDDRVPLPGEPWPERAAVELLFNENQAAMARLHEAAALGGATRYPTRFQDSVAMELIGIQELRAAARMLHLEAYLRAHQGDTEGAVTSLSSLFRLADSISNYPGIVPHLVQIAIAGLGAEGLRQLGPYLELTTEHHQRLQQDLQQLDFDRSLYLAMLGERVMGLQAINDPTVLSDELQQRAEQVRHWSQMWRSADRAFYLRQMRVLVEGSQQPWPDKFEAVERFKQQLDENRDANLLVRMQYLLSELLLPATEVVFEATARAVASRDAALVVLAIAEYQQRTGELPETLEQLVPHELPTVPIDPFDGQPLRYKREAEQFIIYSVGKDRRDDGGQGDLSGEPDLVFGTGSQESSGP